jgi:hypothetical protein
VTDRDLLDDVIAKLQEMEEQLSMAQLEATAQSLLASRIRHLSILAVHIRSQLEGAKAAGAVLAKGDAESRGKPARR